MKISLITTVYNEEKAIGAFLDSLFASSKKPDEIIIVDALSSDTTASIIKEYNRKSKNKVKIILIEKKCNRSTGRNIAIQHTTGDIIATSDVGCIFDNKWLENITKPFEDPTIDVVAGYYHPVTSSIFEKCLAAYTCVMPDKINKNNFLPSSRSVAFTRKSWSDVHGYPQYLNTCEDLIFAQRLQTAKKKFTFVENAFVYWQQRKNIRAAAQQFFSYAIGDGQAHFFRKTTPLLYGRYFIGSILLAYALHAHNRNMLYILALLYIFYLIWAIVKNYAYVRNWKGFFYLPLLQIIADISVLSGTTIGYIQSLL